MSAIWVAIFAIGAVLATWFGTGAVRRYALRRALVDLPNHRSSHSDPTPRGGGLSIAVVTLAAILLLTAAGLVALEAGLGLAIGGAIVATIGWIDDHRHVPARWRALAQLVAASWAVYWIGVPDALWLGAWSVPLGPVGALLAVLGLVWLTNLFNFMDGIDGIAASEAATVAIAGGAMLLVAGASGPGAVSLAIAAASVGFLVWNWPPAKIFMGDVGSGLLGFLIGGIALAGAAGGAVPLLVWGILLGVFLFDATATLFRRVLAGERFFEAHRRHAYQRAVQGGHTHLRVTSTVIVLNAILACLAAASWTVPSIAPYLLGLALIVLAAAYLGVERLLPMWHEPPLIKDAGEETTEQKDARGAPAPDITRAR